MSEIIPIVVGAVSLMIGSIFGYYVRQSLAKRNYETIEAKLQKKVKRAREEAENIITQASEKASQLIQESKREIDERNIEIIRREKILLKRENTLDQKHVDYEKKEKDFNEKVEKLKVIKGNIEQLHLEAAKKLEEVAQISAEDAKKEIIAKVEKENSEEVMAKIREIEKEGWEKYEEKAKEIVSLVIQKCAVAQTQEITTTTVSLPSDEVKGRIIGKEGRNIKTLEKLTGVEIIVDDTPEAVVISGFDPVRRHIAKIALEKLIRDGRIQPARIEETVIWAETEIQKQIKEAGELAVYETGVVGLDPKLVQLIGRLRFRTSYGQNALLHSVEASFLAGSLAAEIGANVMIAKKAGLLHDIGKAIDHQVEGSHTEIGAKILEKFSVEPDVIKAVRSHHEEHPYETIESIIVQTADAISGARPGARKDNLENYLKRLAELEDIANSFEGVEKSYAIAAGREIRVFVRPNQVNDLQARNIARGVAKRIQEELKYPGEIKVNVIRESRVIEFAK
ncbi:MAG: ribonuclease Y [Candidatus Nealsonbacteria bacterium]|nr:ribonuclease Y [Candidatus Nealsonbacteria bacterium]